MNETAPRDLIDSILKVQDRQMKLAGVLQGNGIWVSIGKPGRAGGNEEDIIARIKANAPLLRVDESLPGEPGALTLSLEVRFGAHAGIMYAHNGGEAQ